MSTMTHHPLRVSQAARSYPTRGGTVSRLLSTERDYATTLLRLAVAGIMFPHGAQHMLGWFGGYGFSGTHQWMTVTLGFPAPLAAVAIVTEFLAPLALMLGLGGRVAALGIVALMIGAAGTHVQNGFFMNWYGSLPAGEEGFEFHLLVIAIALAIAIRGSGALSVDRLIVRLEPRKNDPSDQAR